jgi:hypothetical protein
MEPNGLYSLVGVSSNLGETPDHGPIQIQSSSSTDTVGAPEDCTTLCCKPSILCGESWPLEWLSLGKENLR